MGEARDWQREENRRIADTIMDQINGRRLVIMIGANTFQVQERGLSFKFPRNHGGKKDANYIKIQLNSADLYDVEFGRIWDVSYTVLAEHEDVYFDALLTSD